MTDTPVTPNPVLHVKRCVDAAGTFLGNRHYYWCPGCDDLHAIMCGRPQGVAGPNWTWDGNMTHPTYSPSQLTSYGKSGKRCHTFIRQGIIEFLGDCTHDKKGTKHPMIPLPDWFMEHIQGD